MKKFIASLFLFISAALFLSAGCDCSMVHVPESPFPGSLRGEALSSTEVRLTWSMPTDLDRTGDFSVYRGDTLIGASYCYYYTDTGLTPGQTYKYFVRIRGKAGKNAFTNTVAVTTNPQGNVFYVDPAAGSMDNDGSSDHPWRTLQEVFENGLIEMKNYVNHPAGNGGGAMEIINEGAPVKGGDVIRLRNGYHGVLELHGGYNDRFITIEADDGETPVLSNVEMTSVSRWRLRGLTVTQDQSLTGIAPQQVTLVYIRPDNWGGPAHDIIVQDCTLSSIEDASSWTASDWIANDCNGIMSWAENVLIENNYLKNVNFGISADGDRTVVRNNTVDTFDGDGMRGNAHDLTFEGNTVKNCIDSGNGNHDDGFQSFSVNGAPPWERVVLRGNTIINNEDPDQPLRGCLQGIGCFDGWYINWIVENNLVIVDHWHGISLYGAIDCRIVNNTVLNPYPVIDQAHSIWIMVTSHKDGSPSSGCLIRNNIAWNLNYSGDTDLDHNIIISDPDAYADYFIDPDSFDFHLRGDAQEIIDTGSPALAPLVDLDGNGRPSGAAVDPGAFEYVP